MSALGDLAQREAREALHDALMQPTHAPLHTHDPRDGACRECPWPVHMLPVPDVADALAPAALGALASPEVLRGIAEVLAEHGEVSERRTVKGSRIFYDKECAACGHGLAWDEWRSDLFAHQAEALVAALTGKADRA